MSLTREANLTNLDLSVGFIDYEDDDTDLGLSFAIYVAGEYYDSLILARSIYDLLLSEDERKTRISYDVLDDSIDPIYLQQAHMKGSVLELTCESHCFTLDLSKLEAGGVNIIQAQLKKLNADNCFVLRFDGGD